MHKCNVIINLFAQKQTLNLKLGVVVTRASDSVYTVVALWGFGQRHIFFLDLLTFTQRHVTDQQQPRTVSGAGFRVFKTGAAEIVQRK